MFHNDGCMFPASITDKDAFIERIRTDARRVSGPQWRARARSAVTICVLANQGGMRA
jgi:hypothetical protein